MATQVQNRRGSTSEHASFTGAVGEITVDTDKDVVVVHDGSTAGGHPALKQDGSNSALALGSASSPSLKFTGDTNTGLFSPGNDQLALATGGTERLRLDSSGRLGLGTSSPAAPLTVVAPSANTDVAIFNGSTGTSRGLKLSTGTNFNSDAVVIYDAQEATYGAHLFRTCGTYALFIDQSQRVGIGTTAPQGKLIVSNGGANGIEFFPDTDSGANSTINSFNRSSSTFSALSINAAQHIFLTSSSERARIDSSGRLLVGTSSSRSNAFGASTFQLEDAGGLFSVTQNANNAFGGAFVLAKTRGSSFQTVTSGDNLGILSWQGANGSALIEGARIQADVDGVVSGGGAGDLPTRLVFSTTADGASSPTERMRISNNGTIAINGTASTQQLSITHDGRDGVAITDSNGSSAQANILFSNTKAGGTSNYYLLGYANSVATFIVYSNGDVRNTNNSYGAISDSKLKENIVDANSQWDDLKALQVRNYNFKEGQTHTQIGLVAQEVELVSPGLVTESPDRDEEGNDLGTVTKSVNYSVLYMKAIKALQEAMERIETLEAKVAALEAQ